MQFNSSLNINWNTQFKLENHLDNGKLRICQLSHQKLVSVIIDDEKLLLNIVNDDLKIPVKSYSSTFCSESQTIIAQAYQPGLEKVYTVTLCKYNSN